MVSQKKLIFAKPNKKNTQPMRKSACIKIFCASAAVIVPLTLGLLGLKCVRIAVNP